MARNVERPANNKRAAHIAALWAGAFSLFGCGTSSSPATTATASTTTAPPSPAAPTTPTTSTTAATTIPSPTTLPPTTAATIATASTTIPAAAEEAAITARVIEFYQQLYTCYGPERCDFDQLMATYLTPGSPAIEGFRTPVDEFVADGFVGTDLDAVEYRVDSVELQGAEDRKESGSVVLCQFDPTKVVDATGNVINEDVSINRIKVVVVRAEDQWLIFEASTNPIQPGESSCGF